MKWLVRIEAGADTAAIRSLLDGVKIGFLAVAIPGASVKDCSTRAALDVEFSLSSKRQARVLAGTLLCTLQDEHPTVRITLGVDARELGGVA